MSTALRILFVLPGLHRVRRGAEVAFENIAAGLARLPGFAVTLIGAGEARPGTPYAWRHAGLVRRERFARWPSLPPLRNDCRYEELTFLPALWRAYDPSAYDVTVTCSYPFVNWLLRMKKRRGRRPAHVFVTENGDWPVRRENGEYRWFSCDGLVCTNPQYHDRHRERWTSALIPNGVDVEAFRPGPGARAGFGMPDAGKIVLMVSALVPIKRVTEGIRAVARLPHVGLVLAGDGPQRAECETLGQRLLGERFARVTVPPEHMPALYRSADVFLHMSREEAFGNVYIEALACGKPVVAHNYPVARWIVNGSGELVDAADTGAVAAALERALAPEAPERAAARHADMRERFAWPGIARQYGDFLPQIARCA